MTGEHRYRPAVAGEDAVADAVTDVGADTIRELQRIREELATIRAWVTFFGWLVIIWLTVTLGVGIALGILLAIQQTTT